MDDARDIEFLQEWVFRKAPKAKVSSKLKEGRRFVKAEKTNDHVR